jgi:hypothetical protein
MRAVLVSCLAAVLGEAQVEHPVAAVLDPRGCLNLAAELDRVQPKNVPSWRLAGEGQSLRCDPLSLAQPPAAGAVQVEVAP